MPEGRTPKHPKKHTLRERETGREWERDSGTLLIFLVSTICSAFQLLLLLGCFVQLVTVWVTISFLLLCSLSFLFFRLPLPLSLPLPLLASGKFDILVMANCRMYCIQLFCCHCVTHNPLRSRSRSRFRSRFRSHIKSNSYKNMYIYIKYILLYVFVLPSKMSVHSVAWSLPPSMFIVLALNIVAPPIIYDARLQLLRRGTFPSGLWPSFSSHRLPSNKFMLFISSCHNFTLKYAHTHIQRHTHAYKVLGHFLSSVYFSLLL